MAREIQKNGRTYHQCEECTLMYGKKAIAKQCEAWCKEHKSCNIDIMKRAVLVPGNGQTTARGKEERAAKRDGRLAERARAERKRKFARATKRGAIAAASLAALGLLGWYSATRPAVPESEIISQSGLHWHPELSIIIKGKKQEIPAGIGLGAVEQAIHTHDATGQIHFEFQGLVRGDDLRLGQFFKIWGKMFNRNQILGSVNGPEGTVTMSVNGKPNTEFERYVMKDKDKIEIKYETNQ